MNKDLFEELMQLPESKRAYILSGIVGIIENDDSTLANTIKMHIMSKINLFKDDDSDEA